MEIAIQLTMIAMISQIKISHGINPIYSQRRPIHAVKILKKYINNSHKMLTKS